ncbi:MAG: outer membrane lipoprotein-sorting protein [Deltaproteobacteria bacterium]|nr:outer membrane lipoprotein-sorting protein [Deltaproteobacteria bacterium]
MKALLLVLLFPCVALADDPSAQQIADKAKDKNNTIGFDDATADIVLKVTTKSKEVRLRQMTIKSKKNEGLSKSVVRFLAPPDVAGAAFLAIENKGRDNDQFLFLPALGKTKRISSSQRSQSFMGTDFSYGDFDGKYLSDANVTKLADETVDGAACYVLDSVPKEAQAGEYGKAKVWIEKSTFMVRKVEFYDKQSSLWKVLRVVKVKNIEGRTVIAESVMEDVKKGSKTEVQLGKIDFKAKIGDDEFTEKALSRG